MKPTPLHLGEKRTVERVFTQQDFDDFARFSGDDNPIHVDPLFAARTRFGRTVAHGMLLFGVLSKGLTSFSPYYFLNSCQLTFLQPTYTHELMTFHLEVVGYQNPDHPSATIAYVDSTVVNPAGEVVMEGRCGLQSVEYAGEVEGKPRPDPIAPPIFSGPAQMGRLALGQTAAMAVRFSHANLDRYEALTGDRHPEHHTPVFPVVPYPLIGSVFSNLLGTKLPGRGTNWLKYKFARVWIIEYNLDYIAQVEVVRLRPDKQLVNLALRLCFENGEEVGVGEALVLVKDLEDSDA